MRVYLDENRTELVTVVCNACRKELLVENGILKEECIHVEHNFGFFGSRDGECDTFDLCEDCYRKIVANFSIPVEKWERKELL
ncbi:MAG: hypothetical protein ACI4SN_07900 [Lachnospiraceae bacterium]|nr:hypothetical protein [Lachnospiraceae bacterium]